MSHSRVQINYETQLCAATTVNITTATTTTIDLNVRTYWVNSGHKRSTTYWGVRFGLIRLLLTCRCCRCCCRCVYFFSCVLLDCCSVSILITKTLQNTHLFDACKHVEQMFQFVFLTNHFHVFFSAVASSEALVRWNFIGLRSIDHLLLIGFW